MKKIFYLLAITSLFSCSSIKVTDINSDASKNKNGFYYALPKSILVATFEIEKKVIKPGKLSAYSNCFSLKSTQKDSSFQIKNIQISTKTKLDETKIYQINMSRNFLNKSEFQFEYSKDGELTTTDIKNQSQIVPLINTVVNFASIIPTIAGIKANNCNIPKPVQEIYDKIGNYQTDINALLKSPESIEKDVIEYKIQKMNQLKDDALSQFTGTTTTKTILIEFEINPSDLMKKTDKETHYIPKDLFLFDSKKGIKFIDVIQNHQNNEFENDNITGGNTIAIKISNLDDSTSKKINSLEKNTEENASFFYNIPASAKFQITKIKDTQHSILKEAEFQIPQFGIVSAAPGNMKNINFKLHPGLGSIQSITGTTNTADLSELNSSPEKISAILDKFKKPDPKEELIKQLEQDVKIKELQEQLNSDSEE